MTFAFDHLDFVGLRQVTRHFRGLADRVPSFALPLPFRLVRLLVSRLILAALIGVSLSVEPLLGWRRNRPPRHPRHPAIAA